MSHEPSQQPERRDVEATIRTVKALGDRTKLLRNARTPFHWSDGMFVLFGIMWLAFAYQALTSIEAYKAYDMQRLTPTHLLSPAVDVTMGFGFILHAAISALRRRVDALTKLLESAQEQ